MTAYPKDWKLWGWGEQIHVGLLGMVIWELASMAASRYPHQTRWATTILAGTMAIAFALCTVDNVGIFANGANASVRDGILMRKYFSAAYFVTVAFTAWFFNVVPTRIPDNLRLHMRLVATYCALYAAGYYVILLDVRHRPWASIVLMTGVTVTYAIYAILWKGNEKAAPRRMEPLAEEKYRLIRTALRRVAGSEPPRERLQ